MQFQRVSSLLLLLAFASVLIYGGQAGRTESDERAAAIAGHNSEIEQAMAGWLDDLRELERFGSAAEVPPATGSAMDLVFASSLPQEPLADFAVGQSDLLPFAAALFALASGTGEASLGARLPAFGFRPLLALLYGFFWLMLIAWVASYNRSGEFNLLALLGLWAGLTLVIPAATSATAEALYPTPSRLAYLADAREVENKTRLREADVANQFMLDHPELLVDQESQIPAFVMSSFLVTSTVDEATRPIVDSFEEALRNRENAIGLFRFVSPAVAANSLFVELAGTSAHRHQDYLTQARQFKAGYAELVGPNIVAKQPIDSGFYQTIPEFSFEGEALFARLARGMAPMIFLLLLSIGMMPLVNRRLRSASPINS